MLKKLCRKYSEKLIRIFHIVKRLRLKNENQWWAILCESFIFLFFYPAETIQNRKINNFK